MSIGNQKTKDDGFVNVSTKVPLHVAKFLNIVAQSKGTDIYGLLQLFVQTIIRAAKCETKLPPRLELLMHMLEIDADWNKAFNFASPVDRSEVAQCILVLQQPGKKGFGLAMIDKPWLPGEKPKVTYCVDDILERVAEVSMAGLYKELRQVGVRAKTRSLRETLMLMCDAQLAILMSEAGEEELPQLGNFSDFGRIIEYGQRTRQKKHRSPDSLANQQQRLDFRPHGEEEL